MGVPPVREVLAANAAVAAVGNGEEALRCAPCDVRILGATASPIIQRTAQVAAGQIIARYKEERCVFMQSVTGPKRPASAASGSARDAAVELLLALTLNLPCWVLLGVVLSSWDVKML